MTCEDGATLQQQDESPCRRRLYSLEAGTASPSNALVCDEETDRGVVGGGADIFGITASDYTQALDKGFGVLNSSTRGQLAGAVESLT